jgi:acyl-CoA dehydrogenase
VSYLSFASAGLERFFEPRHRALGDQLTDMVPALREMSHDARAVSEKLAALGLYAHLIPQAAEEIDVRSLVLAREALGYAHPQADAIFAVQGLGTYPIVLAGADDQKKRYLPEVLRGERIGAFALTEPEAGSDVGSLRCEARRDGDDWVLDGEKTLISNVPIADHYIVFARVHGEEKSISAFIVDRDASGLTLSVQPMSSDHPIGELELRGCRLQASALLGSVGGGMRLALTTLETFRISVGAAANGMASAALEDTLAHVQRRRQFGKPIADQQLVQAYLAEMATELDAARLLVARAAWLKDVRGGRASGEVAIAKMYATEAAQRIIDKAVQLHGGRGVLLGTRVESLYRDIRPLRIYEGTTEIQKLIIARHLLGR